MCLGICICPYKYTREYKTFFIIFVLRSNRTSFHISIMAQRRLVRKSIQRSFVKFSSPCFLVLFMLMMIVSMVIEQSNGIYLDCQGRCLAQDPEGQTREKLRECQDMCEILEILAKEEPRSGKHYRYRLFKWNPNKENSTFIHCSFQYPNFARLL